VIGDFLQNGWTFARLARVKDQDMVKLVQDSVDQLEGR
jgi:hypothetical protein